MAQRTAAERLLAAPAKTAGAGLCLALAVAALAGCGGSSSDSGSTAAVGTTASTAAAASSPDSPSSQGAEQASAGGAKGQGEGGGRQSSAAKGGGGPGHAPVELPKSEAGREHAPTAAEKAHSAIADMTLVSPSFPMAEGIAAIPAAYACDGANSTPALRWAGVPAGTEELILYVMNAKPVGGRLFFDWAVAGIDPSSESLEAGALPSGAVVGTNSFGKPGYDICPEAGGAETYIFALFALPRSLSPKPGFDPRALRAQTLGLSGDVGLLTAIYARS
ncbi:MAG TPA: YbhB/YbcL family Raf kinase inhibitor-like protein [Solirubrobacterales bacterium]|nr:YbhB/YbcL family Raf kinase inhibitor-like protein [Solirubrobacterales bacterium]